jgi:chromate transporter
VAKSARIGWTNVWIPVLSALLIVCFGVSPIYIIMVAVVAGILWGRVKGGKV